MAKAKKLDGRAVFELFISLSTLEQAVFYGWCTWDKAPDSFIRDINATMRKATHDNGSAAMRFQADLLKYRRQAEKAVRDARIVELRDRDHLSFGQIGRHPEVIALNDGKPMEYGAVQQAYKRFKDKLAG